MSGPHSYLPGPGLTYDPSEPRYWDPSALQEELRRVFEVCHGCRMCFKYCDSFPDLFKFIDDEHDGDVGKVTEAQTAQVMDECFQCKLCEVQCPYTPRDSHEFQLDFPKLVHRYKAQRARKDGVPWAARVRADADGAGRMARASLGMANVMNRVSAHRWFMEKLIGVHREKLLPDFAGSTFEKWSQQEGLIADEPAGEVVLFQTCYVQNNEPEIGRDTVDVYRKNSIDIKCAKGLQCCGMPHWEAGDLDTLRAKASHNLDILTPFVDAGAKVVAINPTCAMMMRREWPELLEGEDRERATKLAEAVRDPSQYLWSLRKEERFNTQFQSTPESVAYHAPCHLRAQAVGFRGRDLMKKIPGVKPVMTMECCGHDGTFAMTVDGFEPSQRVGKKAFDGLKDVDAKVWATDCPLAAIQFQQHAGKKPLHPMSVLARAYRADGFEKAVDTENT